MGLSFSFTLLLGTTSLYSKYSSPPLLKKKKIPFSICPYWPYWDHTCLTQNCIFRNENHQNLEHSIIFRNTSANVSPHQWNKSGYQILWENHRAIYTKHLPYPFRAAENTVCRSRSTVHQFNHFTTLLQTSEFTRVSLFSSTVATDHFSRCTFFNGWKLLLFAWDGSAGVRSIDLALLSLIQEMFLHMAPWFQSLQLAALRKLRRNFFCFMSFAHAQSTSESKSALCLSFTHAQRIKEWLL